MLVVRRISDCKYSIQLEQMTKQENIYGEKPENYDVIWCLFEHTNIWIIIPLCADGQELETWINVDDLIYMELLGCFLFGGKCNHGFSFNIR